MSNPVNREITIFFTGQTDGQIQLLNPTAFVWGKNTSLLYASFQTSIKVPAWK